MSIISPSKRFICLLLVTLITLCTPSALPLSHVWTSSRAVAFAAPTATPRAAEPTQRASIAEAFAKLPLRFEANLNQTYPGAKFSARANGYSVFVAPTEAVIELPLPQAAASHSDARLIALRMKLLGANPAARVGGGDELAGKSNYFVGSEAAKWRTNIATYARVQVENIYQGIDVVYYGEGRELEYDFKLAPGADYKAIDLRFEGARQVRVERSGELVIDTVAGEIRQHKPVAYQFIAGARREVAAGYVVNNNRQVEFAIGDYDKQQRLVIDPVLSYSSYFGGQRDDRAYGVAVDVSGSVYITGETFSFDLPLKAAIQPVHAQPYSDVFIAKLNATGTELIYSTYLGGSISDTGNAIAVDGAGNAYVTGATSSTNFPITAGAFQPALADGRNFDAFVVKLTADGSALSYSTYLGGGKTEFTAYDVSNSIAVDAFGNAYVTGRTGSTDFPTTPDAVQQTLHTNMDAFVTKLNATGTALVYSTYLGGDLDEEGRGIALDAVGNAYVTGYTRSINFPITPGALQPNNGSAATLLEDAFITKLNATGTALVYSTYLGGSSTDQGNAIAVDAAGNAYVAGATQSFNLPTTADALKREFGGGFYKSGNGGRRWQVSNTGLSAPSAGALAIDPKTSSHLYLTSTGGLYTSTDSGDSWRLVSRTGINNLIIDPVNPSILYGNGFDVMKSTDGGLTWAAATNGLPALFSTYKLLIDPLHPATLYVIGQGFFGADETAGNATSRRAAQSLQGPPPPTPHYFFKSTDGGANWEEIRSLFLFQPPDALVMNPQDSSTLFISSAGLLYRSRDGGATWRLMSDHTSYSPLAVDPKTPGILYGLGLGIGKSTDDGRTWTAISKGLPAEFFLRSFAVVPTTPTTLYVGTEDGIFKSADGGNNWQESTVAGNIAFVAVDPLDTSTVYTGINDPSDAFVAKLDASGSALQYATYLGGQSNDEARSVALDNAGNAYVTGITFSSSFPIQNALQSSKPRTAVYSAFLAKLNDTGSGLLFSTYFGGSKDTTDGQAVCVSAVGDVYVTGWTATPDIPAKGALQSAFAGDSDGFLFKLGAPRVTLVSLSGKRLRVVGENFDPGATVLINGQEQKTKNDAATPATQLIGKKAGKNIPPGQAVKIQVRNSDGTLSNEFTFTRSFE